jgi:Ca2+-binding RTX toxin-like protein
LALGTLGATVTTLNAGSNTATGTGVSATMGAAATATITGGTGNDSINISAVLGDVSIAGGAGNDTVTVTTNLTTTDTIGGGDGTADVLSTTAAVAEGYTAPTTRTITGFEQLTLSTASSAGVTLTTANIDTGITRVNLAGTGGAHGITGPAGALTVTSTAALGGTLTLTDTGTATSDAATLTNSGVSNANVLNGAAVTSTGYETLTINVGSASATNAAAQTLGAVTVTVDTGGASAVNFTGANSLTTGAVSATTISASGMTGAATLTLGSATGATSITGTANNDSIGASSVAASVTAGAGADTITGGTLNDTINGGDGNDSITGHVGKDSLTGGAGVDTFVFAANASNAVVSNQSNVDVITDFTSGTDKLSITNITSGAVSKFLNNYANFTTANAAAAADGTAGLAFFVTGENNLYVQAVAGTQGVNDTVINLASVASLTAADLLLGTQGTGNTVVLAAATIPVVSTTTSNATSSVLATAFDDTFTSSASTALVGTGAALTGGAGNDTLNSTLATQGLVTSLTTAGSAGVALSGIEVANFNVTASTAVLNVGTLPTDLKTITATATDLNGALQATTSAAGQTVTVTNTLGTTASAITVGNFSNQTITTGNAGDGVTVSGGALTNYISVNTSAGNDTVTLGALTALTGTNNVLNGSTGTDTLAFYGLSSLEAVNLATLITAGTIAGFEAVTFADGHDSAHAITAATGIVSYTASPSAAAAEVYNISATAAQANAITTIANAGSATGLVNLLITTAGDVSFVDDTTTAVNLISYQDVAVNLTLNNTANTVTQGATTAGTAAQTVTFSTVAAAQTVTINSTGTVAFNVTPALGVLLTAGAVADTTPIAVAGATVSLNWIGTAGTVIDINDPDLQIGVSVGGVENNAGANLDVINVGGVVGAQFFTYGTGLAATATRVTIPVNATETGATQYSYTFITDDAGTSDQTLSITGFDAGTGGDKILLSNAANAIGDSAVLKIATAGYTYDATNAIAAGAEANILVLQATAHQVTGALNQVANAGAVEAAILAAGLVSGTAHAAVSTYIALDNGVDTGIYRVVLDASANAGIVDSVDEITAVVLVATLVGVSDVSTLVGTNFA